MKAIIQFLLFISLALSADPLPIRNPQFEDGTNQWRLTGGAFLAVPGQGIPIGGQSSAGLAGIGSCWRQFNIPITNGVTYVTPHVAQVIHVSTPGYTRDIYVDFVENYPGTNKASAKYTITNGIPREIPLVIQVGPCKSLGNTNRGVGSYYIRGDCLVIDTW